jgi:predicted metal-binding membrane protein
MPALQALLRHDRTIVLACLVVVVLLAWVWLFLGAGIQMSTMDMGGGNIMMMSPEWTVGYVLLTFLMWAIMMMAMMLPSASPAILLASALMRPRDGDHILGPTGLFVLGYLVVWVAFSLGGTALQWGLDRTGLLSTEMSVSSATLAGVLLIAAGVYQWTPWKRACLVHCRAPFGDLTKFWRRGAFGPMLAGLAHGSFCLGCCWLLMTLLFVGGVMNLLWIGVLALLVLVEKAVPVGPRISRWVGAALIGWGAVVLIR